ncbi:MAG: hypothetical protein H8D77_02310 [Chloroflexi bacterium]|nr:hypothetical protein [Chloroflexota bacterium]
MEQSAVQELLARLMALESDVRYQAPASDGEAEFQHQPGHIPVLLSAPHGAVHRREGRLKEEDEYTAAMARLVAKRTGAHALYVRRRSPTDPNWYRDVPYKQRLREVIEQGAVRFVLDLHAAAPSRAFGIALGTMVGESCPHHRQAIIRTLEQGGFRREGQGIDRLDVDETFTALGRAGQETITRYVWEGLHVPAAQLEFHPCLRVAERRADATSSVPFHGDPMHIARAIRVLVDLVQLTASS